MKHRFFLHILKDSTFSLMFFYYFILWIIFWNLLRIWYLKDFRCYYSVLSILPYGIYSEQSFEILISFSSNGLLGILFEPFFYSNFFSILFWILSKVLRACMITWGKFLFSLTFLLNWSILIPLYSSISLYDENYPHLHIR